MAQFDKDIEITLNNDFFEGLNRTAEFTFYATYASSILKGFYYINLRRHTPWNYVDDTLATYDLEQRIADELASGADMATAWDETMKDLKLAFENILMVAPVNTLKWWVADHNPWEFVRLEIGENVSRTTFDNSEL